MLQLNWLFSVLLLACLKQQKWWKEVKWYRIRSHRMTTKLLQQHLHYQKPLDDASLDSKPPDTKPVVK